MVGHELAAEDPPVGYSSLVSGFELQYSSPGRLTNNGSSFADIQHVGITDNLAVVQSGKVEDATIYFGITTYADWSTPESSCL